MRKLMAVFALAGTLVGCGHSQLHYTPNAGALGWEQAVALVEQGFYEDYGDQKPLAVQVTEEAIILSDGDITTGSYSGTAIPVYGAAVVVGASKSKTVSAGQRIYFKTLLPSLVMQKNMRANRFAVVIRQAPGFTARRVYFRSQSMAQQFADALEVLRTHSATAAAATPAASSEISKDQYKQVLIKQLREQSPSYEEYTRRMREISSM